MPTLLWDASGSIKRYIRERGSDTVNALFAAASPSRMIFTVPGYAEAYAILRRQLNAGLLSESAYMLVRSAFKQEIFDGGDFELLTINDQLIVNSLDLIDRHNLNSSDAAILATYLEFQQSAPAFGAPCVLIASDHRMLRAAAAEGLAVLDPERVAAGDVAAFLGAL